MDLNAVAIRLVTFLDRVIGKDVELKIQSLPLDPVYSEVGQGTLFRVYLPSTASGEVPAAHTPVPLANGQQFRGTELILIAKNMNQSGRWPGTHS